MSTVQPKSVSYFLSCPDAVQKIYSKRPPVSCTNTLKDFIDLGNHEIVKNTKTWLSWEQKITFLRKKKLFNLCLFLHFWEYLFSRIPCSSQSTYMYCCGNTVSSSRQRCLFILGWSPFEWWYLNKNMDWTFCDVGQTWSSSFSRGLVKTESELLDQLRLT